MASLNKVRKIKYALMTLTLLFFLFAAVGGKWAWKEYSPLFNELQKKDPEQFSMILKEVRSLHFLEARRLALELHQMTPNQLRWNRYRRLKQKLRDDAGFRQEVMLTRQKTSETARAEQMKYYSRQIGERQNTPAPVTYWNDRQPWQKSLLLREICQRIFSDKTKPPISFCDQAIPLGHDERFVVRALENLKMEMDYFDFSQILSEAGIPAENVFSYSGKLKKMTGSLGGA